MDARTLDTESLLIAKHFDREGDKLRVTRPSNNKQGHARIGCHSISQWEPLDIVFKNGNQREHIWKAEWTVGTRMSSSRRPIFSEHPYGYLVSSKVCRQSFA
jgi:hypothetical protein